MSDEQQITMAQLRWPERTRKYGYADGTFVQFKDVTHVLARPSGTHRLKTADGMLHIVNPGWRFITIDADDWTL